MAAGDRTAGGAKRRGISSFIGGSQLSDGEGKDAVHSDFGRCPIARGRRRMTARLDAAAGDPQQTIAELQRQLDECRTKLAARDSDLQESLEYQSATRLTRPPSPRATGRTQGCAALPDRISARSPGDPAGGPLTSTPTLPHRGGGSQRRGGLGATPDDPADPAQRIADLQRQLAECRAEFNEGVQQESATCFTHPPPSMGEG